MGADGRGLELEPDLEAKLRAFYRPYNEQLYKLVGKDLGWEKEAGRVYVGSKSKSKSQSQSKVAPAPPAGGAAATAAVAAAAVER